MKFALYIFLLATLISCGLGGVEPNNVKKTDNKLPYFLQLSYNLCVGHGFKKEWELRQCTIEKAASDCELYKLDFPICNQLLGKSSEPFIWPS